VEDSARAESAALASDAAAPPGVESAAEPTAPTPRSSAPETPAAAPRAEERPTAPATHPPLDDSELPELVVTEFKGPGRLRPAGLEHTPSSADIHAAVTPPAGTLVVTELDEPPPEPEPRFQLDAPVRGDEPIQVPESSFHDVAQALRQPADARSTSPIPLLPSMETAAPDEVPIPPPPPLEVAPILEEGAVRIEAGAEPARPGPVEPTVESPSEGSEVAAPAPSASPAPSIADVPPPVQLRTGSEVPTATAAGVQGPEAGGPTPERPASAGVAELGIELNPESIRVAWHHDGRAEPLMLDVAGQRVEVPVRLVREPGAPPRLLPPEEADPAVWVGAPLPFLGVRADSDASRTLARRWPAALVPDDRGEAAFALEGGTVRATELVATLLRWIRHRAEELTSRQTARVVLTVPVAYNTLQRERLREAAERAGFETVRLVQAPTAATMAFAHGRGLARRRILVWRMGATTCDIAVLAASGNDLDMVACAGDASLGTVNFDEQIALALDKAARGDAAVLRRRIGEAARLRVQLEDPSLAEAALEGGSRLSRAELEVRTTALVERAVLLAREVLRSASLTPEALDELVLVGTAARLPHVRRMVEEAMGRSARTDVDLAAAPSMGAATLSHLLVAAGPKSASRTALHEVLGVPLEIIAPELGQVRALDRNTRLPAEKTLTVPLGIGTPLEVQVFQGPARAPDPRSFLGLLRAPADRAGDWTLQLSLDTDGVLRASATNPSGKRLPLQLHVPASSPETETSPPQRVASEPETPVTASKQDTGVLGGLKRLFGRR
jgi:actin-like ATPase involved in cell morphogenesis